MIRIETERLVIRTFQKSDAAGLLDYLLNPRVNCFLDEMLSTMEEAIAYVEQKEKDELQLAVCLKEDDRIIGNIFALKEEPYTYSVGWQFNGRYEGKGYASEAAKAYLTFLFNEKDARRIYAYVEDTNIRSQKLCERLGMRKEGCFKEFISFTKNEDGTQRYEDTIQYAVLKMEWIF